MARLPMVVGYRLNPLTEALLDRVLKVRQVNLVNLLLDEPLVCELLGPGCTPERLAAALAELVRDERVRARIGRGMMRPSRRLGADGRVAEPAGRRPDPRSSSPHAGRGSSMSTARRNSR